VLDGERGIASGFVNDKTFYQLKIRDKITISPPKIPLSPDL
jgi:hypothetical protein